MPDVLVLCSIGDAARARLEADPAVLFADRLDAIQDRALRSVSVVAVRSDTRLGEAELDRLPALRLVLRAGSGCDNVDFAELTRRGIELRRNPGASAHAVADLALMALIGLSRRAFVAGSELLAGTWTKRETVGEPLRGLDVAIWGAGPVGLACFARLEPEVRRVRFAAWPSLPPGARAAPSAELTARADVHVLALPLRPVTHQYFGGRFFASARAARPYLINVGRYELVDDGAMFAALRAGELRGAFVDPVERTDVPAIQQTSGAMLNFWATPHIGAQRGDVMERQGEWLIEALSEVMESV